MRYSDDDAVDKFVVGLVCGLNPNPYSVPQGIAEGTGTIATIIAAVRRRHGPRAARAVKITVH